MTSIIRPRLTSIIENACHRCLSTQSAFKVIDFSQSKNATSEKNASDFREKEDALKGALAVAYAGGGPKAIEHHVKRNKKMMVEDRVKELLDENSPFLELSPLAGFMMEYGTVPRAGALTGQIR